MKIYYTKLSTQGSWIFFRGCPFVLYRLKRKAIIGDKTCMKSYFLGSWFWPKNSRLSGWDREFEKPESCFFFPPDRIWVWNSPRWNLDPGGKPTISKGWGIIGWPMNRKVQWVPGHPGVKPRHLQQKPSRKGKDLLFRWAILNENSGCLGP